MNTQWYNENELRKYPISELATGVDLAGVALPNSVIVDLKITVPDHYSGIYLSSLFVGAAGVMVGISNSEHGILLLAYSRSNLVPYTAYQLTSATDPYYPSQGYIVFGEGINQLFYSVMRFDYAGGRIEDRCVSYVNSTWSTIGIDGMQLALSGVVALKSKSGLQIYKSDELDNTILFKLLNPETYIGPCNHTADLAGYSKAVHTINGVSPDENGIITLEFQ